MAVKGYSALPKIQHHLNFNIRSFSVISRTLIGVGSYSLSRLGPLLWVEHSVIKIYILALPYVDI